MRVLFVVNRASGTGRAERLAGEFVSACEGVGVVAAVCDARDERPEGMERKKFLQKHDCVAVVGGDGSLHHLLEAVRGAGSGTGVENAGDVEGMGVPVYHIPAGTENLFAREFGMTREPEVFVRALERGRLRTIDLGRLGGNEREKERRNAERKRGERDFALMVSFGPDAGVIHRLDKVRSRAVGHVAYLRPVLEEVLKPRVAHVRVRVDGQEVVGGTCGERGMLVVANSRQYARRLDPARKADMTDRLLDVVFLPGQTTAKMVCWAARCAMGEHLENEEAVWVRGREIEVVACGQTPWQCDGEAGGWLEEGEGMKIRVEPGAVRVLEP
ncbi:hypothetical protein MNBD_PLANCTO03-564 [hydrothermal vent metagenome]|uniref:DAGKc domain-containing protein n=1 Tax=hydrothermal vent metagenome TaxID=652676 RepID=A0A3B1DY87_9ZZZZ